MSKRRREDCKPLSSCRDAPYNSNKRVLLSYESEDELEDGNENTLHNTEDHITPEVDTTGYQIEEYAESDYDPNDLSDVIRVTKEDIIETDDNVASEAFETSTAHNERRSRSRVKHKNDATAQWAALGSLSYQWEDGEEGELEGYDSTEEFADEEAMAYLRSVRSQRQKMPAVLRGKRTYTNEELYESGLGDTRGYFDDGAYVASARFGPLVSEKEAVEPQEAYITSLKQRFLQQRQRLQETPPRIKPTDPATTTSTEDSIAFSAKRKSDWLPLMTTTVPKPAQLLSLPQSTIFRLLKAIRRHCLVRENEISTNISTWIWSLLVRLDDVGTMDNDRVSSIREFGKRAVLVQLSFDNAAAAKQLAGADGAEDGSETADETEPNGDKGATESPAVNAEPEIKDLESEDSTARRERTLATLDMIIVIVAEIFGQRDLLEFRRSWTQEMEGAATNI